MKKSGYLAIVAFMGFNAFASTDAVTLWMTPTPGCTDSLRLYDFARELSLRSGTKRALKIKFFPSPVFIAPDGALDTRGFMYGVALRCIESQDLIKADPFFRAIYRQCSALQKTEDVKSCLLKQSEFVKTDQSKLLTCLSPALSLAESGKAPQEWSMLSAEIRSVLEDYAQASKQEGTSCRFLVVGNRTYNFSVSTTEPHPDLDQEFTSVRRMVLSK